MKDKNNENQDNEKTFGENLEELEKIASELERQDISLEKALSDFEKGIKLSKICNQKLEQAEKKINILVQSEDGKLKEEKFNNLDQE